MRTIGFRGKSKVNVNYLGEDEPLVKIGQWVYGSLVVEKDFKQHPFHYLIRTITRRGAEFVIVEEGSIGQHTGLRDAEGNAIYEGDILRHGNFKGVVCWNSKGNFYLNDNKNLGEKDCENLGNILEYEDFVVVGNIHDNPEFWR